LPFECTLCHLSAFKQGSTLGKGTTGLLHVRESAGRVSMCNQDSNDIQEMDTYFNYQENSSVTKANQCDFELKEQICTYKCRYVKQPLTKFTISQQHLHHDSLICENAMVL